MKTTITAQYFGEKMPGGDWWRPGYLGDTVRLGEVPVVIEDVIRADGRPGRDLVSRFEATTDCLVAAIGYVDQDGRPVRIIRNGKMTMTETFTPISLLGRETLAQQGSAETGDALESRQPVDDDDLEWAIVREQAAS